MKIAVYAAAGNIGSRIVRSLAQSEHTPVALLRTMAKQADLPARCEVRRVELPNAGQLAEALHDADALFWVTPSNTAVADIERWYADSTAALETVLAGQPMRRIVHVSSLGAGMKPDLGTISYVGDVEKRLNRAARHVVHLRPGYFMQNLFMSAADLVAQSALRLPYAPDHDIPWISVGDIAQAAVKYLIDDSWTGQWYCNLMGPRNLTGLELAAALSIGLGRPIRYEQVALKDQRAVFASFGMPPRVVDELIDLMAGLGDPNGIYATPRTHDAFTPTTIEQFIERELKPVLAGTGQQ